VRRLDPAWLVVLGGISAALHVGKLPPALPVLQQSLGVSLLQAGFLLSLVQLAGMTLGLAAGLAADSLGPRRVMVAGLMILSASSLLGGWAERPEVLLVLRACEGLGFLLASLPAPSLIRRLVDPQRLSAAMGLWGAYMPIGTAAALLTGPAVIAALGWPGWWWALGLLSLAMGVWLWAALPAHCDRPPAHAATALGARLRRTLAAPGPWLAALSFAVYSGQWLAVIGFLPSIYAQAALAPAWAAPATALAAGVNLVGNIASGRLLQRGVPARRLLQAGYLAMGVGAVLAFAPITDAAGGATWVVRYGGVLLFSMLGGMVPGTLFALSVRLAPDEGTLSTTVGWMQQWSSLGQFVGPPVVAWVAARQGNWESTWTVTVAMAMAGIGFAMAIARLLSAQDAGARPRPAAS
jgi:CP family cyanate transporter-like MFS transporter